MIPGSTFNVQTVGLTRILFILNGWFVGAILHEPGSGQVIEQA